MNSVNCQLATEWQACVCYVFKLSLLEWEAWGYWPDKPPKLLLRGKSGMDLQVVKNAADKMAKKLGVPVGLFDHVTVEQ